MSTGRLAKKTGLYFIGNLSSKIVSAAILPIYAFFVLPNDLGAFDNAQVWANIFATVCFMAIWEAILKFFIAEENKEKLEKRISTVLFFIVCAITATIVISLIIGYFYNIQYLGVTVCMLISIGMAQMWQYFARALHENTTYVKASITGTLTNFSMLLILVCVLRLGLIGLSISYIMGQVIIVILIEYKVKIIKRFNYKRIDLGELKSMLIYSVPLVLNITSLWLLNGFGRIIIVNKLGAEANGLYTFALKFGSLVSIIGSVIGMAMCEEAILKINDPDISEFFSDVNTRLFRLFLSICILMAPAITVFYYIIGGTEYFSSLKLAMLFLLNAVFLVMSTNIGTVFNATNKTKLTFTTTVSGTAVMVIVSYLLIGRMGIAGVAIGQILGSFTMMICRWRYAKKLVNMKIKLNSILVLFIIYIIDFVISVNIGVILNFVLFVLCCLAIFIVNKKDVIDILNVVKGKIKFLRK